MTDKQMEAFLLGAPLVELENDGEMLEYEKNDKDSDESENSKFVGNNE